MLNNGHGGYSADMTARGRVCLTMAMVVTALTWVRVDVCT